METRSQATLALARELVDDIELSRLQADSDRAAVFAVEDSAANLEQLPLG